MVIGVEALENLVHPLKQERPEPMERAVVPNERN